MDIIIAIVFLAVLVIISGLSTYFILKETNNVTISKNIVYWAFFKVLLAFLLVQIFGKF